jgi:hypothetical protein
MRCDLIGREEIPAPGARSTDVSRRRRFSKSTVANPVDEIYGQPSDLNSPLEGKEDQVACSGQTSQREFNITYNDKHLIH